MTRRARKPAIAAEEMVNQEQMVISDLDLKLLEEQVSGTVIPLNDLIQDAYDRAIHYADLPNEEIRGR